MPGRKRVWSRELKISAVKRMLAGENTTASAKELKVAEQFCTGGATAIGRMAQERFRDGRGVRQNCRGTLKR